MFGIFKKDLSKQIEAARIEMEQKVASDVRYKLRLYFLDNSFVDTPVFEPEYSVYERQGEVRSHFYSSKERVSYYRTNAIKFAISVGNTTYNSRFIKAVELIPVEGH